MEVRNWPALNSLERETVANRTENRRFGRDDIVPPRPSPSGWEESNCQLNRPFEHQKCEGTAEARMAEAHTHQPLQCPSCASDVQNIDVDDVDVVASVAFDVIGPDVKRQKEYFGMRFDLLFLRCFSCGIETGNGHHLI